MGYLVTLSCGCTALEDNAPKIGDDYWCFVHGDKESVISISDDPIVRSFGLSHHQSKELPDDK